MVRKIGSTTKKKRKAPAKKTTTRRKARRVSGIGAIGGMIQTAAALVAGSVAAREANALLIKMGVNVDPKIASIGQMIIGYALPKYILKNQFGKDMGAGMIAEGGKNLLVNVGVIGGIGATGVRYTIGKVNPGRSNLNVISGNVNPGDSPLSVVSGVGNRRIRTNRSFSGIN